MKNTHKHKNKKYAAMDSLHFEKLYKKKGIMSQRRYPNEALLQFLGSYYFQIPKGLRTKVKILELGCGSGANLWMIAREGFSAYGIDIAPTGLELCKKVLDTWGVKARLSLENMQNLSFEDNSFDLIFDVVSMQHLDVNGHAAAYKEVFRCLKKGGRFFQWHLGAKSTPFNEGDIEFIDQFTIADISDPGLPLYNAGLTCFLTPDAARKILKSAGFRDIVIESYTRSYKNISQTVEYLYVKAGRD